MTPEEFKDLLLAMPAEQRLATVAPMWQHIEGQQPGWETLSELLSGVNVNDFNDVQPSGGGIGDFLSFLFSPGPNALNQLNRVGSPDADHGYDPSMSYADAFRNAGYGDAAASALGFGGDLLEPGPGELVAALKAIGPLLGLSPLLRGAARRAPDAVEKMLLQGGDGAQRLADELAGGVRDASAAVSIPLTPAGVPQLPTSSTLRSVAQTDPASASAWLLELGFPEPYADAIIRNTLAGDEATATVLMREAYTRMPDVPPSEADDFVRIFSETPMDSWGKGKLEDMRDVQRPRGMSEYEYDWRRLFDPQPDAEPNLLLRWILNAPESK